MDFSQETITEAIDRAYNSPMFTGVLISQQGLTALILGFCGEIEGNKYRAMYEQARAEHQKKDYELAEAEEAYEANNLVA